jgi:hypothetical protein
MLNWNLVLNILSVLCGSLAVYYAARYPMAAIILAFLSGINVALSARFDIAITKE